MSNPIEPGKVAEAPKPLNTAVSAGTAPKQPEPLVTAAPSTADVAKLLLEVARLQQKVDTRIPDVPLATKGVSAADIDWSKVTDKQIAELDFPIPVIEHELPDYMNVHLADNNYIAKWIHKLPSHLGTMKASGYDFITESDWDNNFPKVLAFNSEGHLAIEDVVACKIHKSRYFGKIKREAIKSMAIRGVAGYDKVKGQLNQSIANTPGMESAINRGAMAFYGEQAESNVEQHVRI